MSRAKEVRKLRQEGMSIDDICESLGYKEPSERREVLRICRKAGMPITEEEHQKAKQRKDDEWKHGNEWADAYINEKTGGRFERISDYNGMDAHIIIRCKTCGCEKDINFSRLRSNKDIRCLECFKTETERKKKQEEESARRNRLMRAEERRINNIKGKQMFLRFCIDCGEALTTERERCTRCQKSMKNKNKEVKRRAKIRSAMVDRDITLDKVFKKDKGRCHICGKVCDINDYIVKDGAFIAGNYYPSIDHVIPLAKGGQHSWDNVKLAHRICNSLKKDNL